MVLSMVAAALLRVATDQSLNSLRHTTPFNLCRPAAERTWTKYASQGQVLALA